MSPPVQVRTSRPWTFALLLSLAILIVLTTALRPSEPTGRAEDFRKREPVRRAQVVERPVEQVVERPADDERRPCKCAAPPHVKAPDAI